TLSSTNGSVTVGQSSLTGVVTGSARSLYQVTTTASGLNVGSISTNANGTASDGSISIVAGTGTLIVKDLAVLNAKGGNIVLQNADAGGFISLAPLGQGATITASKGGSATGEIDIYIGS